MGIQTTYRGYTLYVTNTHITAQAPRPSRDEFTAESMARIRAWVKRHERANRKAVT